MKKKAHIKMLLDFQDIISKISDGREIADSCYMLLSDSIDKILSMDNSHAQFHAKYLMGIMGHSIAAILLLHIGNETGNKDFIEAGKLYFQKYVKKEDYDKDALETAESLIHVERQERSLKN
jgi:hypothetical protein